MVTFVNFHDGTGCVTKAETGVKSAKELDGATVCLLPGTELDVAGWFRA